MELKKTPKANLEKKRILFLCIGFVISLGSVLLVLNLNNAVKPVKAFDPPAVDNITIEMVPPIATEKIKLPTPPTIKNFDKIEIREDTSSFPEIDFPSDDSLLTIGNPKPKIPIEPVNAVDTILPYAEDMPEFPGGSTGLLKWIQRHIKYPQNAIDNGIKGTVYVQFVVGKEGEIAKASIYRGIDPLLDQEALRVVKSLPKWKPGMQNGRLVLVFYVVPINFILK